MAVVIETTIGDFTVDLYTEERPQTCRNFLKLCKIKYYNWNLFHTVQSNFIAQTGDPTGTGKGGESIYGQVLGDKARYYESEQMPKIKHDRVGLLSMVNCGDNMLGSQFFITLAPDLQSLDGEHCVFGEIAEGLEIILKLNETICDNDHRPYQDIRISHTVILEDPFDDPKGLIIPERSPEPTKEALMSDRIGADEEIDDTTGMTAEEIMEMQKEKEAKARATILEIVGDIPDAEMAPPENVLFVCKLNPVTTDDDLEIIFSRFGEIIGCEVIRDRQTGDSLQYAFIEFADRKSCEDAYFKMDNVLIDDRRIHVDFSQSVAKMRWKGKGKGIQYFDKENDSKEPSKEKHDKTKDKTRDRNYKENEKEDRKRYNKYDEDMLEHRKYERRKDYGRDDGNGYNRNEDKQTSQSNKEKYRDYKKSNNYSYERCTEDKRDNKRDRDRKYNERSNDKDQGQNRNRSRERDREKSKDRSRERDRDRSNRGDIIERSYYKDSKYDKKYNTDTKRHKRREYDSEEEIERNGKDNEKYSSHKSKRIRDRSEERHNRHSKRKHKR